MGANYTYIDFLGISAGDLSPLYSDLIHQYLECGPSIPAATFRIFRIRLNAHPCDEYLPVPCQVKVRAITRWNFDDIRVIQAMQKDPTAYVHQPFLRHVTAPDREADKEPSRARACGAGCCGASRCAGGRRWRARV